VISPINVVFFGLDLAGILHEIFDVAHLAQAGQGSCIPFPGNIIKINILKLLSLL